MNLQFISSLDADAPPPSQILGSARLGAEAGGPLPGWPEQRIGARVLGPAPAVINEYWRLDEALVSGCSEGIVWRRSKDLLYGVIDLDEAEFADAADAPPLQAASRAAYDRLFRLLDAQGLPHVWRVWNYVAQINAETHGLERYRQFNIGRQEAFVRHQRGATGNMPAACAIGLAGGPLSIAFLAGPTAARPIENPRQVSAYHYPTTYGPRAPVFSRASLVCEPGQEILFISGTASIVGHQTVHLGDVAAQSRETIANIAAVVQEANRVARSRPFSLDELVYRVYVRRTEDFASIRDTVTPLLGQAQVVYVQGDICRADLEVEIEATGFHPLGHD